MNTKYKMLTAFSLSLVSLTTQATATTDCGGSVCENKNIVINSPNYFDANNTNITGNSQVTIEKGGSIIKNRQNFQANSHLIVNTEDGITGNANVWVMRGATATFNVSNAMTGGSYTSNGVGTGGILNLNATKAISGGKLLFDNDATININAENAIVNVTGNNLRFKGNSVINLNHKNALSNVTLKLEGDSRININTDDALGFSNNINFAKTFDTKNGSVLELNGHSLTVGSISGNDNQAKIVNSGSADSFIYSGLTNYGVLAGRSYNYLDLLKTGVIRSDAVIASTLGDINRQAVLSMLPKFSDRAIPEPGGILSNGQGIWLRGIYNTEKRKGEGITYNRWKGYNTGMQIGFDLWPASEDASNKLGIYFSWLNGKSDIISKSIYRNVDKIGQYKFNMYGTGIYHHYTTTQGWYINTTLLWNIYSGDAKERYLDSKAKIKGQGLLAGTEIGYPITLTESFTILPTITLDYQKLRMKDYQFKNLYVNNSPDNLLQASAGTKLYYNLISVSGIQWSPFLDINLVTQLAARDKNNVRVIDSGYQQRLLTTYANSLGELNGGVIVKINDNLHYYAKVSLSKAFKYQSENTWSGSTGLSFYW